ncbi:hypothetical protein [uncultured Chryseobacterium sp.]|uniref:hypothetical protein n=1 Tax=uncultured Chryseobacterium sp. TaxID=259322 RepID=UPI0025EE2B2A|nr:hypothetical protein [uncultured Chryseobacterium sp.]
MNKSIFYIMAFCIMYSCKSFTKSTFQSNCGNNFEVQYIKSGKYKISEEERAKNYLSIYLLEQFNDQIKISINEKEVFNKNVVTDTTKFDRYSAAFRYNLTSEEKKIYIMKVFSDKNKECLEIPIDTKYRIIYLYYHNKKWIVRFSNELLIN